MASSSICQVKRHNSIYLMLFVSDATKGLCIQEDTDSGNTAGAYLNGPRHLVEVYHIQGLSWRLSGRESICQCRRHGFSPWVRKVQWRRKWQLTLVIFPGKSDGQRSLVGYSPWGHKRVGHGLVAQQQQQTIPMAGRRRSVINREHLCDTLYMTRMKT